MSEQAKADGVIYAGIRFALQLCTDCGLSQEDAAFTTEEVKAGLRRELGLE